MLPAALAVLAFAAPASAAPALLPWPSDAYTRHDATTDTGRRLNLQITQMPANAAGVPVDPTAFNRNDGFSPGTLIVTRIPQITTQAAFDANGFPTNTDPGRSFDENAKIVVIDATARRHPRQLIWADLEYPPGTSADVQTLVIHPGK